ncbi:hypothetical protein [Streptomyces sp. NPDC056361]|uniref:hypothetical protein n=1 Tax=Streptomyces sp. NPDC056361 TaxID=3345795 RepID=UPI0035D85431
MRSFVRLAVTALAALAIAAFGITPASAVAETTTATATATAQSGGYASGGYAKRTHEGQRKAYGIAAPAGVAATTPAARGYRTYDLGVYPGYVCDYLSAYYRAYYAARGYRVYSQCIYLGGIPPFHRSLLRVTLAV